MSELTFRQLQTEQIAWVQHNFPGRDTYYPLLGAMEELGELSHHHLKRIQGVRGTAVEHHEKAKDAIADVIIFLSDYCTANGYDLQEIIETTWAEVKQRDWKRDPQKGGSESVPCWGTSELPSIAVLSGSDPNSTDDATTEEYIQWGRKFYR